MKNEGKREKNWKDLYIRSTKLARAKQLGIDYPRISDAELRKNSVSEASEKIMFFSFVVRINGEARRQKQFGAIIQN